MTKLLFAGDALLSDPTTFGVTDDLHTLITSHDVASVDVEGPETKASTPIKKFGPALKQATGALAALKRAGFTLFHAANNHIADYGLTGITDTIAAAGDTPLLGVGTTFTDTYRLHLTILQGRRFGFLSFAEWGFGAADETSHAGFAWINHPAVTKLIRDARAQVDVLIVQVHAGVEKVSIPLPEWRTRYRELIDLGATLVVAHHPHITQGFERYGQGMIFYSLGNFLLDSEPNLEPGSYGAVLSVEFSENQIADARLIPILVTTTGQVGIDHRPEAAAHLTHLCTQLTDSYDTLVASTVLDLWQTRYQHFYQTSLGGFRTLRGFVRSLIRATEGETVNYRLLSHNLNIESHRFVAMRVAKIRTK
jgi:poly-gamma-glutamate synthesis protein (capsule biosynthesis protein)